MLSKLSKKLEYKVQLKKGRKFRIVLEVTETWGRTALFQSQNKRKTRWFSVTYILGAEWLRFSVDGSHGLSLVLEVFCSEVF